MATNNNPCPICKGNGLLHNPNPNIKQLDKCFACGGSGKNNPDVAWNENNGKIKSVPNAIFAIKSQTTILNNCEHCTGSGCPYCLPLKYTEENAED